MSEEKKVYDIKDRTFLFSKSVIFFIKSAQYHRIYHSLFDQLLRSATSVGANITEGKAGSSKNDFFEVSYYRIKVGKRNRILVETCR